MINRKILFVLTFVFVAKSHAIANFSFLQQQPSARKSGLGKMGVGAALFTAAYTQTDSIPVNIAQKMGALGGGACFVAGLYQMYVDCVAEEEAKSSVHPDTSRFDIFINKVITHKAFLTGAALGVLGLILQKSNGDVPDTSFACNVAALTLMGVTLGTQFSKDYLPEIIKFFNK